MTCPDIYDRYDITPTEGGYYRHPTVHQGQVIFVSEDDLWSVPVDGGVARRLTADKGQISYPVFSPDGRHVAYTSTEQGCPEVFVMAATGGACRKLTFNGAHETSVCGWSPDGSQVYFRSNRSEPFQKRLSLYSVPFQGGHWQRMQLGPGYALAHQPEGPGRVLVRHTDDLGWWKRYRGGTAGQLWIDSQGQDQWERLLPEITAGMCRAMWIGDRIYFITDDDGTGNLYSCTPDGDDFRRHSSHEGHYVRFASEHEGLIVYTRAGQLYRFDTADDSCTPIEVDYPSARPHRKAKYVDAEDYLEEFTLHPEGHSLAVTSRGKAFCFGNWEGAVRQAGRRHGVRYRLAHFIDAHRLLAVSDESGEERFEIHEIDGDGVEIVDTGDFDIGSPTQIAVSPEGDQILFSNHRFEVVHLRLHDGHCRLVDDSSNDPVSGMSWAPDNRHAAYAVHDSYHTAVIKIADLKEETTTAVTRGEFRDVEPAFDPQGRYLYFLSYRQFTPTRDQLFEELSFPKGCKPCVVTLRSDLDSPFVKKPRSLHDDASGDDDDDSGDDFSIDFDQIRDRIEMFPVAEANYEEIQATKKRVFWTAFGPETSFDFEDDFDGKLQYYDLCTHKVESFADRVSSFVMGRDHKTIALYGEEGLRVVSASSDSVDDDADEPGRKSGIIDLERVTVAIDPRAEWSQMLRDAWRLMRDNFWRADMGGVDWDEIWERYKEVLPRLSARIEFSDLIWMMQGELGTSHAYTWGGDFEIPPQYQPGFLGADLERHEFDKNNVGFRIEHILRGDPWDSRCQSPLLRPGVDADEDDVIVAINGQPVSEHTAPGELLAMQAGREVALSVVDADGTRRRQVTIKPVRDEMALRYRDWVERNRRVVHQATDGQIGYLHIPDMMLMGFAEFHRQFLTEHRRPGLIVDARFNGGGYVSALLLEKLARKPLGYNLSRHRSMPVSYPMEAVRGPMVALTNARAGSDGDIFSHCFKDLDLGPLIGERTWGGTIGIWPRRPLADGSYTSQPEFSFWFDRVGYGLENHGATPDIEVPFPPTATDGEKDPQLLRAIEVGLEELEDADILEAPEHPSR